MVKKIGIVGMGSLTAAALFGGAVTVEMLGGVEETNASGSITLSPDMIVPPASELLNQPASHEDVERTMNLEDIKLAAKISMSIISAGIENHLGYTEEQLTQDQVLLFNTTANQYASSIQTLADKETSPEAIDEVLKEFVQWTVDYREAITAEFKAQKELEEAKLRQAEEEAKEKAKEVTEVVGVESAEESSIIETSKIAYAIPDLKDEYLTYMPYTAITAKNTPHYRLQQLATTTEEGYRVHEGAICVALASSYGTTIGTIYDITFEDGKTMRAILADNKSDKHTDPNKQYRDASGAYDGKSGNILEIVFDVEGYPDMYAVNKKINSDYPAHIKSIVKLGVAEGFGE